MPLRFGGAAFFFVAGRATRTFKYGGEGGIDSLRSPCGQPTHCVRGLSNCLRQLPNPGRGFSSPLVCNMRKKSSHFRTSSFLNMAVRGGFEPPIRCRIHAFQACSFSHSDTSPNFLSSIAGTGANLGKSALKVNKLFLKIDRLDNFQSKSLFINQLLLFLPPAVNLLC